MRSIRELYRVGLGPSSSHTIGPHRAATLFAQRYPQAAAFRVTLYGALAATGRGHRTDVAIERTLHPRPAAIEWRSKESLPEHPNGMHWEALAGDGAVLGEWTTYSVGGGALSDDADDTQGMYPVRTLGEILAWCEAEESPLWRFVERHEGADIWPFLADVWRAMRESIERGLAAEGILPGGLGVKRRARQVLERGRTPAGGDRSTRLAAYAYAVSEENADSGVVVTAPTCGGAGVLPAVLFHTERAELGDETVILRALATAGLIGNLIKHNSSISGAEVGCQGEVGAACSMAAAAVAQALGGTNRQIEYAAEMGLEHHLGLTCDPVRGLVQVPCIERNAHAAMRAWDCAQMALLSDGEHLVPFDDVVKVMLEVGRAMPSQYRETAEGGLAVLTRLAEPNCD